MKKIRIDREEAIFVGIDFQEKLMPAMKNSEELEQQTIKLIKGLKVLGIPMIFTQQYTKGLGMTSQSFQDAFCKSQGEEFPESEFSYIEKTSFSAMGEPDFEHTLKKSKRNTVIIAGIEAHVCVQLTVLDLIENGYHVFVVNDCISSRSNTDKKYAQRRMGDSGAIGTTYESVLFELCGGAKDKSFKQISAIVK